MDFETAVERLTRKWVDVLTPKESPTGKYYAVDREPLLESLRKRISSSVGTQSEHGGSGQNAIPIDTEAFDLWQHIDESVDAWNLDIGHLAHGELTQRLAELAVRIDTAWRTGDISEVRRAHLQHMIIGWAERIIASLEGWRTLFLLAECPECHETWVSDPREQITTQHCLQVHFRDGGSEAWAECRRCEHTWTGPLELAELGFRIGAHQDIDTLRAYGITTV